MTHTKLMGYLSHVIFLNSSGVMFNFYVSTWLGCGARYLVTYYADCF